MELEETKPRQSQRMTDVQYINQLEFQIEELSIRFENFRKLMDKALMSGSPLEVTNCYVKYISYLQGNKTLQECEKQ